MGKIDYIGKCLLIEGKGGRILCIGDLHLGYEEHMNRTGVFVSRKMFEETILYLERVFEKVGKIDKVILLGDVKHDFGKIMKQERDDFEDLISFLRRKCKEVLIVKGNHDKLIESIAREKSVEIKDFFVLEEFCFLHGDKDFLEIYDKEVKYWILGHGHPAVKISDGVKMEKYKCFLVGKFEKKEIVVVPSFIEVSEGSDPRENDLGFAWKFDLDKFRVMIVSGEELEVLDFGLLKKLE
jgi:uncharacterized protein